MYHFCKLRDSRQVFNTWQLGQVPQSRGLTISSGFASAIGTRLMMGADELDEIRASQEAKSASAEIIDLLGKAA